MKIKLGEWLKEKRQQLGWSQEHTARVLGISLRTLIRWERDESDMPGWAVVELQQKEPV